MKTERGEGDQRHVEFTITLLGCTVIKEKSPRRERGGSRPAQSVLSLPWSPACRPQKHTAKPSGRTPFIALDPPHHPPNGSKESAKQAQIVVALAPLNLEEEGLPWMSRCLDPKVFFLFFFDVLMKIFHTFLRASCYARTCQPPRLGKKRIFGMWFPQKFRLKEIKKKERRRGNEKISLLNLH